MTYYVQYALFKKITIEKFGEGTAWLQTWNVIALIPCTHLARRATGNSDRCIQSYGILSRTTGMSTFTLFGRWSKEDHLKSYKGFYLLNLSIFKVSKFIVN